MRLSIPQEIINPTPTGDPSTPSSVEPAKLTVPEPEAPIYFQALGNILSTHLQDNVLTATYSSRWTCGCGQAPWRFVGYLFLYNIRTHAVIQLVKTCIWTWKPINDGSHYWLLIPAVLGRQASCRNSDGDWSASANELLIFLQPSSFTIHGNIISYICFLC